MYWMYGCLVRGSNVAVPVGAGMLLALSIRPTTQQETRQLITHHCLLGDEENLILILSHLSGVLSSVQESRDRKFIHRLFLLHCLFFGTRRQNLIFRKITKMEIANHAITQALYASPDI